MFFYLIKTCLKFGEKYKPKNFLQANKIIFKEYSGIFNFFIMLCYFIVLAGMFAAVYEIYLNIANPMWAKIFVLITLFFCIIENSSGIDTINFVNNIFVPITMVILIISASLGINNLGIFNLSNTNYGAFNSVKALLSLVSFIGMNILLTSGVLMQEGKRYTLKDISKSSFFSALILCIIMLLFNLAMLLFNADSEMPLLSLSFSINYWWGILVLVCIWYCVYSNIITLTYVLTKSFNYKKLGNSGASIVVVTIAYIISLFGFGAIVKYLYPVIGVFGVVFCIIVLRTMRFNKKQNTTQTVNKASL